jgi:hypothetical protein
MVTQYKESVFRWRSLREIRAAGGSDFLRFSNWTDRANLHFEEDTIQALFIGWVELHTDLPAKNEKKWRIRVIYQAPGCAFVYTGKDGKFAMIRRFDPKVTVEIDFRKPHALVPTALASKMVELNSSDFYEYQSFENRARVEYSDNPKLVWTFINGKQ